MSEPLSTPREALAQAIEAQTLAQANLDEARIAAKKAQANWSAANRTVDDLVEQIEHAEHESPDDAFITEIALGNVDIATLARPGADLKERLAEAERDVEAWDKARDIADQSIPIRAQSLDWATRNVDAAARKVMAQETNIAALLCTAAAAQGEVIAKRAELIALTGALEHNTETRKSIERFLSDPWLLNIDWAAHPAAKRIADSFAALKADSYTAKAH